MKFYCIYETADKSVQLLKEACENKKLEFVPIAAENFNFLGEKKLEKGDLLYRAGTSKRAKIIERELYQDGIISLYKRTEGPLMEVNPIAAYQKHNISIPKTVYLLSRDREELQKYVEYLGGFPIIIKALGGSHGVGVMKIDSFSSLFSVVDHLLSFGKKETYILREFIDVKKSARLIVLGDKVVDSIEYSAPEGDFRSNAGKNPIVCQKTFASEIQETAVKAINCKGLEFGGADVLIDAQGRHYLAEANFPCFFPRCQMLTGTNIAEMIVDHLLEKAKA